MPPQKILNEIEIKPSFFLLDYGCGPGSFSLAAAEIVGKTGKVFALDIHPLAIKKVKKKSSQQGYSNIEIIHSDCETGLGDNTIDVALLFDIIHMLSEPEKILQEIHRILKPKGRLSLTIHRPDRKKAIRKVEQTDLFQFSFKGKHTYNFFKI
ncbi:MAG: class I SAM-dependent methyltransferase [Candidatus Heimdallarchaeota archaeon]|nr:class I SAM-dependent methyltransferase [Candidatus Heimdallarchaeota archaeon]